MHKLVLCMGWFACRLCIIFSYNSPHCFIIWAIKIFSWITISDNLFCYVIVCCSEYYRFHILVQNLQSVLLKLQISIIICSAELYFLVPGFRFGFGVKCLGPDRAQPPCATTGSRTLTTQHLSPCALCIATTSPPRASTCRSPGQLAMALAMGHRGRDRPRLHASGAA